MHRFRIVNARLRFRPVFGARGLKLSALIIFALVFFSAVAWAQAEGDASAKAEEKAIAAEKPAAARPDVFRTLGLNGWPQSPIRHIDVMSALTLSAILGALQAFVYRYTLTGKRLFRPQMAYTLLLLCVGGALIWLVIGNSLVRAFGLGGALALIRYRTRVRDPKDMPLVLFAMIIGMACGLKLYFTAIAGTVFIALVLALIRLDWNRRARLDEATPLSERPEVIDAWDDET
jgi:hypothetical protein